MNSEEAKAKFKLFKNKAAKVLVDPKVTQGLKVAREAVDFAGKIAAAKLTGPISAGAFALGTVDTLVRTIGVQPKQEEEIFLAELTAGCMKTTLQSVIKPGEQDAFLRDRGVEIRRINDKKFFEIFIDKVSVGFFTDIVGHQAHFWVKGDAENKKVWRDLACFLGGPVLTTRHKNNDYYLMGRAYPEQKVLGSNSVEDFAARVAKYRKAGLSRAVLLDGPPGSGKTSFMVQYAKYIDKPILIVPPGMVENEGDILSSLQLGVGVLLFDDIDRCGRASQYDLLELIDTIRLRYPHILVAATSNDKSKICEALRRPGRLGEQLTFDAPSREDKKLIFNHYLLKSNPNAVGKFNVDRLLDAMAHRYFSGDYVKAIAEQSLVEDQAGLEAYIRKLIADLDAGFIPDEEEE